MTSRSKNRCKILLLIPCKAREPNLLIIHICVYFFDLQKEDYYSKQSKQPTYVPHVHTRVAMFLSTLVVTRIVIKPSGFNLNCSQVQCVLFELLPIPQFKLWKVWKDCKIPNYVQILRLGIDLCPIQMRGPGISNKWNWTCWPRYWPWFLSSWSCVTYIHESNQSKSARKLFEKRKDCLNKY